MYLYSIVGRKGDRMCFIEHGRVDITRPNGELVTTLTDGSYFGGTNQ